METAQKVYDVLAAYMNKFTSPKSSWYAGIASDPRDRLFSDHNVNESNGLWAFDVCSTDAEARSVEAALLKLGCEGGGGGGDNMTKSCYVYVITTETRE